MIHDGARPFLTLNLIEEGLEIVGETGAAVAAVPVKVRRAGVSILPGQEVQARRDTQCTIAETARGRRLAIDDGQLL